MENSVYILICIISLCAAEKRETVWVSTPLPEKIPYLTTPLCPTRLDIVLAIDSSGSVKDIWNEIIDDAQIFLSNFQISDDIARVAIIDFSAVSNVYTPLDTNNNDDNCYDVLEKMRNRHQNGESWLELGFDRSNDLFRSANPPRLDVRKVLVVYTDGEMTSGDIDSLKEMIKSQREGNVEHYIVKVRNNTETNGLQVFLDEHCRVFPMREPPINDRKSLELAVCYNSSSEGEITTTPQTVTTTPVFNRPELCDLPAEVGPCRAHTMRYFFNKQTGQCEKFFYGGCGGNANNFGQIKECMKTCIGDATFTTTVTPTTYTPPLDTTPTQVTPTPSSTPSHTTTPSVTSTKPKCIQEREEARKLIMSNIPTLVQIFVPQCDENGNYKRIQHHEGTGNYWCVDIETGEPINETRSDKKPDCSLISPEIPSGESKCKGGGCVLVEPGTKEGPGPSPKPEPPKNEPFTDCERQRNGFKGRMNSAMRPECSEVDGLYTDVQKDGERLFCVNRITGVEIEETSLSPGEIPGLVAPQCPEKTKCEREGEEINAQQYHTWKTAQTYIADLSPPICESSGLYKAVQTNFMSSFCVNRFTGEIIKGTMSPNGNVPNCPAQEKSPECLLPKSTEMCRAALPRYFFNTETLMCDKFIYGGCNGNENNFDSWEACEKRCGHLTLCKVTRMREIADKVTDPLKCDKGGDFKEVQSVLNGTKYCVNRYTGERVEGVPLNDQFCNVTRTPKCNSQGNRIPMPGAYIPQCDKDGNFAQVQKYGSTGQQWCVHRYEGTEVAGTRVNPGKEPNCPVAKNEDCLLPKTGDSPRGLFPRYFYNWMTKRCHRFNYDGRSGNGNNFVTLNDCMIACYMTSSYPEGHPLTKAPVNLITPEKTTTTPAPEPEAAPEAEPEGEPAPYDENDRFYPQTTCTTANDFLRSRAIYNHKGTGPLKYDKFECNGNLYAPLQQNTVANRDKWCVDPVTGHLVEGTLKSLDQPLSCPSHVATPETSTGQSSQMNGNTSPQIPEPIPEHIPGANVPNIYQPIPSDKFHPEDSCLEENAKILATNRLGAMMYNCDTNGDYLPEQTHGSTGETWCVNPKTGALINGTKTNIGDKDKKDCNLFLQPQEGSNAKQFGPSNQPDFSSQEFRNPNQGNPLVLPAAQEKVLEASQVSHERLNSTSKQDYTDEKSQPTLEGSTPGGSELQTSPPGNTESKPMQPTLPPPMVHLPSQQTTTERPTPPKHLFPNIVDSPPKSNASLLQAANAGASQAANAGARLGAAAGIAKFKIGNNFDDGENLKPLGCFWYKDYPPGPLPVLLPISATAATDIVMECAKETQGKHWYTFGIKDGTKCMSGPDEGRYNEDGEADAEWCVDANNNECNKEGKTPCVGMRKMSPATKKEQSSYFVYTIITDTHKKIHVIDYDRRKRRSMAKASGRNFFKKLTGKHKKTSRRSA